MTQTTTFLSQFEEDVITGLQSDKKRLSSKYFYDAKGDVLFQQIMMLDEYYLTNKELEIFETQKQQILDSLTQGEAIRIIELGAGDGTKTKILLKHFLESGCEFTYSPVDISGNVLDILENKLKSELPLLNIETYEGDYLHALEEIGKKPGKDVVFFLGSNIGNFGEGGDRGFLTKLHTFMRKGDLLFMGVDMKKDPSIILSAYNDREGVTKEFNLNLLRRINDELDGDFHEDQFQHYPYYNPQTGECRSYLISKKAQTVTIGERVIEFEAWEAIFMETSKKYSESELNEISKEAGFRPVTVFSDQDGWFSDVVWERY